MKQLQIILQARILSVIWIMTKIMTKSKKHLSKSKLESCYTKPTLSSMFRNSLTWSKKANKTLTQVAGFRGVKTATEVFIDMEAFCE